MANTRPSEAATGGLEKLLSLVAGGLLLLAAVTIAAGLLQSGHGTRSSSLPPAKPPADGGLPITEHEVELTVDNFEDVVLGEGLVLVDFSASWCAPCMRLLPHLQEIAVETDGTLTVAVADMTETTPETSAMARAFGVTGYPTFIMLRDGRPLDSLVGPGEEELRRWVAKFTTAG